MCQSGINPLKDLRLVLGMVWLGAWLSKSMTHPKKESSFGWKLRENLGVTWSQTKGTSGELNQFVYTSFSKMGLVLKKEKKCI